MRKNIVRGYFGGLIIFGVLAVNWFIHSGSALAGTPVGKCDRDPVSGTYLCVPPAALGLHILINANPGACHGDIVGLTAAQVNAQITSDFFVDCPVAVGVQMTLPLPPHATPPVATCTKTAGPTNDYTCTAALAEQNHVELNQNPGVCHVTITSVVSAGVGGVAYYRVEEKINGCLPDGGSTGLFPYTIPASPPTINCPDVARGGNHWAKNQIYEFASLGLAIACHPDASGNALNFKPEQPFTRAEAAVWALRLLTRNGNYQPPTTLDPAITCPDVARDGDHWAKNAIYDLASRGMVIACHPDTSGNALNFKPEQPFTRAEAAVWALRFLTGNGSYQPPTTLDPTITCPDVARDGDHWAKNAIYDLASRGMVIACHPDTSGNALNFKPEQPFTRAEAAVWWLRFWFNDGTHTSPPVS